LVCVALILRSCGERTLSLHHHIELFMLLRLDIMDPRIMSSNGMRQVKFLHGIQQTRFLYTILYGGSRVTQGAMNINGRGGTMSLVRS
jgi:hypothetical protein